LVVNWPVFFESLNGLLPDQSPAAVQAVALVLDQVMRDCSPTVTVIGLAEMVTVGAAAVCPLAIDTVVRQATPNKHWVNRVNLANICMTIIPSKSMVPLYVDAGGHAKCRRIPTSG
jgi:hypothetical protein